ncbi:hypothetical protein M3Y94_00305900 [Aphelenchoides besseyi]|nr:hypothetical protein M3Y94_00305900 [Aphelenchoides besseyi]KAI6235784.1 hypothetical protein M3Y95_00088100 [Aphelenchoides besseyi]
MRLSFLLLLLLTTISRRVVAELKSCYNETHWLTGNPTGQKEMCSGNSTEFCYKVIGNTMDKTLNPRGCASTYVRKTCEWYMPPEHKSFCLHIDNEEIHGKLCCCSNDDNCNLAAFARPWNLLLMLVCFVLFSRIL